MEIPLRAALIAWLASDPVLGAALNSVAEEAPVRAALPWLGIAKSSSVDCSTKTEAGFETRIELELQARGDAAGGHAALATAIQSRIASLPRSQSGFRIASIQFLKSSAEQRADQTRAILFEYRFRLFAA
jgi:hypothetical protein